MKESVVSRDDAMSHSLEPEAPQPMEFESFLPAVPAADSNEDEPAVREVAPSIAHRYQIRTWTSGRFSTRASFVAYVGGFVKLRKEDGREVTIDIEQLSDADKHYVEALINRSAR